MLMEVYYSLSSNLDHFGVTRYQFIIKGIFLPLPMPVMDAIML